MKKRKAPGNLTTLNGRGFRFAVIVSQFNEFVTSKLLEGALKCLRQHGVPAGSIEIVRCPGAFELPQVANRLAASGRWNAIICLGAVIRGETSHFKYVSSETVRGIQTVALKHDIPILFGVLTTETERQALARAGGRHGNKGWDAAATAIEMALVFKRYKKAKKH